MHCGLYAAYGHIRFEQRHRQLHGVPSDRIFFGPTSEIVWASYNDNRLEAMHELIVLWWFLSMATNRVIKERLCGWVCVWRGTGSGLCATGSLEHLLEKRCVRASSRACRAMRFHVSTLL